MKPRTAADLNPYFRQTRPEWCQGMLDAANLLNQTYARSFTLPHAPGDVLLSKMNLLRKGKRVRKNMRFR